MPGRRTWRLLARWEGRSMNCCCTQPHQAMPSCRGPPLTQIAGHRAPQQRGNRTSWVCAVQCGQGGPAGGHAVGELDSVQCSPSSSGGEAEVGKEPGLAVVGAVGAVDPAGRHRARGGGFCRRRQAKRSGGGAPVFWTSSRRSLRRLHVEAQPAQQLTPDRSASRSAGQRGKSQPEPASQRAGTG